MFAGPNEWPRMKRQQQLLLLLLLVLLVLLVLLMLLLVSQRPGGIAPDDGVGVGVAWNDSGLRHSNSNIYSRSNRSKPNAKCCAPSPMSQSQFQSQCQCQSQTQSNAPIGPQRLLLSMGLRYQLGTVAPNAHDCDVVGVRLVSVIVTVAATMTVTVIVTVTVLCT
ncbi:hypothetical protein AWZ03_005107 [Drosophila navojoa]|uniref:Uncharacterized protein n=1 Tax=Drosophila navojoa TaxID=7232 RepID=A0A484BIF1_DRONA|nr:hypothetical protein AWZ03_005107 [Drosophila navojoa]